MTNQEFIRRLKEAKNNLNRFSEGLTLQLMVACNDAEICWNTRLKNATFADNTMASFRYLEKFPEDQRRVAAIAVIDASISALEELEQK